MLKKEAIKITGGLTKTTKMPCPSYSLPAQACITGAKLRKIEGTPCNKCYAFKGNFNPKFRPAMLLESGAWNRQPIHNGSKQ